MMFNLMRQGLAVQQKTVDANKRASLTHEEAVAIKAEGKRIVNKPTANDPSGKSFGTLLRDIKARELRAHRKALHEPPPKFEIKEGRENDENFPHDHFSADQRAANDAGVDGDYFK